MVFSDFLIDRYKFCLHLVQRHLPVDGQVTVNLLAIIKTDTTIGIGYYAVLDLLLKTGIKQAEEKQK